MNLLVEYRMQTPEEIREERLQGKNVIWALLEELEEGGGVNADEWLEELLAWEPSQLPPNGCLWSYASRMPVGGAQAV